MMKKNKLKMVNILNHFLGTFCNHDDIIVELSRTISNRSVWRGARLIIDDNVSLSSGMVDYDTIDVFFAAWQLYN